MKYFYAYNESGEVGIIAAETLENATRCAQEDGAGLDNICELKENTFKHEGFLIAKRNALAPNQVAKEYGGCRRTILENFFYPKEAPGYPIGKSWFVKRDELEAYIAKKKTEKRTSS